MKINIGINLLFIIYSTKFMASTFKTLNTKY